MGVVGAGVLGFDATGCGVGVGAGVATGGAGVLGDGIATLVGAEPLRRPRKTFSLVEFTTM